MHTLSICAVVKDEAPYLEEWLEYHLLKGVEHFFIYDNGSTDGTQNILDKYKTLGFVTWELMNDIPIQIKAYQRCINEHRRDTLWCAFIDIDEFIVTQDGTIPDFLNKLSLDISALALHWVLFGSSFHSRNKGGLVIERFLMRALTPNKHVKSIVRLAETAGPNKNPHCFIVIYKAKNEMLVTLPTQYATSDIPTAQKIWINHYHTKSFVEYLTRKLTYPTSKTGVPRTKEEIISMFKDHDKNEISDNSLLEYVPLIKKAIQERK